MSNLSILLDKTDFKNVCKKIIEFQMENSIILVNPLYVTWITLTPDEYEIYKCLLMQPIEDEVKLQSFVMKLIVHNLIRFKNNKNKPQLKKTKTSVYFAPTPYCNLRCVYCYAEAEMPKDSILVPSDTQSLNKLLNNIISDDIDIIHFTGGEPTLCKDIFELASYIKSKNIRVGILTNGTSVTSNNVEQFKIFDKITISLDASRAEINDITRGKGTFERIVSAIKLLRQHDISVSVSSVISKVNFDNVGELLRFVRKDLDVLSHKVALYVSHGRGKNNSNDMELSYDEVITFRSIYIDYLINSHTEDEIIPLLQPPLQQGLIRTGCGVASSEVYVDNEGNVYPCRLFEKTEYILGNIKEHHLSDVIQNQKSKQFKCSMNVDNIQDCKECNFKYLCGGGCRSSHACYTGDINISDKKLCDIIKHDIKSAIVLATGHNPITTKRIGGK